MNWREFPMVRLLLSLILGIGVGSVTGYGQHGIYFISLTVLFASLVWLHARASYARRWWFGTLLTLLFVLLGAWLTQLHYYKIPNAISQGQQTVCGTITAITPTAQKQRLKLRIQSAGPTHDSLASKCGMLLAYLEKRPDSDALQVGDILTLKGNIQEIPPTLNPHAFDYKGYLARKRIYHQVFVFENDWQKLGRHRTLLTVAASWRKYFLSILRQHLPAASEFSVGAALSLGYKSEITDEVRDAYANTGAMHVLAVSGLHVGIVQMIVTWLLGLLTIRWQGWRFVRTLLIITTIWGFALLAGGAPSVLRAATMFSFLAAGLALHRSTNIYNTLAASAFVLLCINPSLLYEVGFQLSYLAVLGIVYFQPRIYRLWYVENKIGDYLWQLAAVSLAAQIATLPISLYYFHQLPVYFILSGLVVVPAAVLILSLSLLLFSLHWVPVLSICLGKVLYGLIAATNSAIFFIHQLPAGLLEGIWLSLGTVVLMYLFITFIAVGIHTRRYAWVQCSFVLLVVIAGWYALREWQVTNQQALVVYHLHGATAVDYFDGKNITSIQANTASKPLQYAAAQHRWYRRAAVQDTLSLQADTASLRWWVRPGYAQMGAYRLAIPHNEPPDCQENPAEADLLLVTSLKVEDKKAWLDCIRPNVAIIDGSVNKWEARTWMSVCKEYGIPVHQTRFDGAYVLGNH